MCCDKGKRPTGFVPVGRLRGGSADALCGYWRRDRDSNPGKSKPFTGFRNQPVRPLRHLSTLLYTCPPSSCQESNGGEGLRRNRLPCGRSRRALPLRGLQNPIQNDENCGSGRINDLHLWSNEGQPRAASNECVKESGRDLFQGRRP